MDAREEILGRIRQAHTEREVDVPREYRRFSDLARDDLVELLIDRLEDYDATVHRARPEHVAGTVATCLAGAARIVVPETVSRSEWLGSVECEILVDSATQPLTVADLDAVDAVVTGSELAVAVSGTIVLVGEASGRRATTLLPDHHVCVVREEDIVEILPEAVDRLIDRGLHTRPITMVSGPSATVDIELIRVQGVHGPRNLDVIIVGQGHG
ncbi:Lactate utilization protein C [Corynebacterium capitovis DSM 44611]|uniref:LutC/YkgG family protein n=1 Tax=Corynebacterium capitovis TaxID=131081 RepID=UPI000373B723|nr:LUD domain-containing protein [Corynebacterium capitovis]WKD57069.1 Lactate utilization protein C [Corynebacterium capitovis DSM 44611]